MTMRPATTMISGVELRRIRSRQQPMLWTRMCKMGAYIDTILCTTEVEVNGLLRDSMNTADVVYFLDPSLPRPVNLLSFA